MPPEKADWSSKWLTKNPPPTPPNLAPLNLVRPKLLLLKRPLPKLLLRP